MKHLVQYILIGATKSIYIPTAITFLFSMVVCGAKLRYQENGEKNPNIKRANKKCPNGISPNSHQKKQSSNWQNSEYILKIFKSIGN